MATYSTLEEIKAGIQNNMFADDYITLRSEQRDAIDKAKEHFCIRSGRRGAYQYTLKSGEQKYLWNAKMRFGKTICAMQLMRELDVKRTLIITHRPVVGDSWQDAFKQVVGSKNPTIQGNSNISRTYDFGTRSDKEEDNKGNYYDLERFVETEGNHYAFFVSMQYIRLSELVNAKTQVRNRERAQNDMFGHSATKENEKLKADILNTDWDLVIIDEAHEGTLTSLGNSVIKDFLKKENTKMLYLSGTPFNLYEDFKEDEIFTWDYIAEQQAKINWEREHPGEKNPYAELPKMNIFTYDITKNINNVLDQSGIFTFNEFFRTWTGNPKADNASMPEGAKGRFVHEEDVNKFLNLLCTKDSENNFPFSTDEYRKMFRHTLWVVSHVNEAAALEKLLKEHRTFHRFDVINVAGQNDSDEERENALDRVLSKIGEMPEMTSTITISCGRLTTGVTVKPWTAVFYLKGGDRAATYMQTIFRVQSPWVIKDEVGNIKKMKTECFVFDFAPDRTLKIVAETAKFSSMAKAKEKSQDENEMDKTQEMRDKETVKDFIELCPVISMDGGKMSPLDVNHIYKQLENVFIDRLVRKGFDDPCLYNQDELNKVNPEIINHIGENGGQAPDERRKNAKENVDLSHMTDEQRAEWEEMIRQKKAEAKAKAEEKTRKDEKFKQDWESWTEEQREEWLQKEAERIARREKAKEERDEFKKRITNIRGIALRIPLLMYGGADAGDTKEDITVDNFTRKIKDESWAEFMPKGISKEDFNKIKKCFNATRFEEAGKKYRALTREADFMHVEDRIKMITDIFSYFRNPDKETVLTPWRVVNMHMSDTIGGYCFFNEKFDGPCSEEVLDENGNVIDEVETNKPRFVNQGDVTRQLFDNVNLTGDLQTKILEINSKTGLYPLYVTYSLYRRRLEEYVKAECITDPSTVSVQEEQVVWDDIVANNMYVICNTPMAVGITRRTLFGFRDVEVKANIKNEQLIERASNDQEGLIKELESYGFWKGNRSKDIMKFNAVVGNPPYQVSTEGESDRRNSFYAIPVYQEFIDVAKKLNPAYISMITPSRWMTKSGQGIKDEWVDEMINGNHFIHISDFLDSTECFSGVSIGSGINYFLYSQLYNGPCDYFLYANGTMTKCRQKLNDSGAGIVIRDPHAARIFQKVLNYEGDYTNKNFSSLISPRDPYTTKINGVSILGTNWTGFSEKEDNEHNIKLYLNKRLVSSGIAWISEKDVKKNTQTIPYHKILIPKAYGSATDPYVIGKPIYASPNSVCSVTYLVVGFNNEIINHTMAENIMTYMSTRFFRYLVSMKKKTQDNPRDVFQFVPLQDFSKPWTDEELYEKYGLDMFEREYIESLIKPME